MTKRRTAIEHYDKLEKFLRFMDASDMDAAPLEPETKMYLEHIWSLVQGNKIHLIDLSEGVEEFVFQEGANRVVACAEEHNGQISLEFLHDGFYNLGLRVPDGSRPAFDHVLIGGGEWPAALISRVSLAFDQADAYSVFAVPGNLEWAASESDLGMEIYLPIFAGTYAPGAESLISVVDPESPFYNDPPEWLGNEPVLDQSNSFKEIIWGGVFAHRASVMAAVINQPTITKLLPGGGGPRQQRRAVTRRLGVPGDKVRQVVWNLDRQAVEAQDRATGRKGVALHIRRGHLRRAKIHYRGAYFDQDRQGWFQWIEDTWVGHPAYGTITRDRYVPLKTTPTNENQKEASDD